MRSGSVQVFYDESHSVTHMCSLLQLKRTFAALAALTTAGGNVHCNQNTQNTIERQQDKFQKRLGIM